MGETYTVQARISAVLIGFLVVFAFAMPVQAANSHSIDLDGSSQYVSITDASQMGLDITGDISIEAWVKIDAIGDRGIVWKNTDNGNQPGYFMQFEDSSGNMRLHMRVSDGTEIAYAFSDETFDDKVGEWVHVAATWENGTTTIPRLFVNGVETTNFISDATGISGVGTNAEPLYIGKGWVGSSVDTFFDGHIEEVRIWDVVRTPTEIAANYNTEIGTSTNLVGYWKFNNDLTDSSGNGNMLTNIGGAIFSTDIPFPVVPDEFRIASINSDGTQGDLGSSFPQVSDDGRYVVFTTQANNLGTVAETTLNDLDVFWKDMATEEIRRVSVASDGTEANGQSSGVYISGNGRYVFFNSDATNLVANDTNGSRDVFAHDTQTGITERISVDSNGNQVATGQQTNAFGSSDDGRYVLFSSEASNMVAGDTNGTTDVFIRDMQTGQIELVSFGGNGASKESDISNDGRYIAFYSDASNLVANDTNSATDAFWYDRQTGSTTRVSVDSNGVEANGGSGASWIQISGDGQYVVFHSNATNLVPGGTAGQTFLHDVTTGVTEQISIASDGSQPNAAGSVGYAISDDGSMVLFSSPATNLVADDSNGVYDVFLRDRNAGNTLRMSMTSVGVSCDSNCIFSDMSADGNAIVFESLTSALVQNDTNGVSDIFYTGTTSSPVNQQPVITLVGSSTITVTEGGTFNDPGATASDPEDGNISGNIVVGGDAVDTNTPGIYVITYNVTDSGGLAAPEVTRTVIVEAGISEDYSNVALLAINSIWMKKDSVLNSGDVIVNGTTSGPYLNANVQLSVGVDVVAATGTELFADSMRLKNGSSLFDVSFNSKTGQGNVSGTETTPLSLPVFSVLPDFNTATVGTTTVKANSFATTTVDAGNYDEFIARATSTVIFTGGIYHFSDVTFRKDSKIFFAAPTEIRIADKLNTNQNVIVQGSAGSGVNASDIFFYVEGINGTSTGALNDDPAVADIGVNNNFSGNVYAPNGRVHVKNDSDVTGALFARDLEVGVRTTITEESGF